MNNLKKYIAEFIGTFVLVLVACGVAVKSTCATERTSPPRSSPRLRSAA